jgi:hypothetical protein
MKYVQSDSDLKKLRPNGRRIRNFILTVNSIAQADGRKMRVKDLMWAVKMSTDFLNYMTAIESDRRSRERLLRA